MGKIKVGVEPVSKQSTADTSSDVEVARRFQVLLQRIRGDMQKIVPLTTVINANVLFQERKIPKGPVVRTMVKAIIVRMHSPMVTSKSITKEFEEQKRLHRRVVKRLKDEVSAITGNPKSEMYKALVSQGIRMISVEISETKARSATALSRLKVLVPYTL